MSTRNQYNQQKDYGVTGKEKCKSSSMESAVTFDNGLLQHQGNEINADWC